MRFKSKSNMDLYPLLYSTSKVETFSKILEGSITDINLLVSTVKRHNPKITISWKHVHNQDPNIVLPCLMLRHMGNLVEKLYFWNHIPALDLFLNDLVGAGSFHHYTLMLPVITSKSGLHLHEMKVRDQSTIMANVELISEFRK